MGRKIYDEYEYIDPDFCYTYKGTSVLKNLFDIKDGDLVQAREYQIAASKLVELGFIPIEVHTMGDVLAIHQFIFGEIYEWAGCYRTVNISKEGKSFMALQSFDTGEEYMNSLLQNYYELGKARLEVAEHLASILKKLMIDTFKKMETC